MDNINISTNLSIFIQIVTGLIGIQGIFVELPIKHLILRELLIIETVVQFIELFYYIFFLRSITSNTLESMASTRYFDWYMTTSLMIVSFSIYFKYYEYLEINKNESITFFNFLKENKNNLIIMVLSNCMMLLFGYLGELQIIDMISSTFIGFIFLGITFYNLYINYAIKSIEATKLFYYILTNWSLYGIFSLLDPYNKNILFNILDLFSKNFFGLYLTYRINTIN
jgi:hypothetical protein